MNRLYIQKQNLIHAYRLRIITLQQFFEILGRLNAQADKETK